MNIFKKNKLKSISGQKQRCIQTPEASNKTQQSSKLTQQHLVFLKKEKLRVYATVCRKPVDIPVKTMCTHDREDKTCVQEEKEIKNKVNRQAKTKFTPIRHY